MWSYWRARRTPARTCRHPRAHATGRATSTAPDDTIHHFDAHRRYGPAMPRRTVSEKRVATAVRLPESLHAQLQEQADLRDVSVNFLVVRAVQQYLEQAPDPLALERSAS